MTVKELIKKLKACNQEQEVVLEKCNLGENIIYIFQEKDKVVIG